MKCVSKGFKSYYKSDDDKVKSIDKGKVLKYELGFDLDEALKFIADWPEKVQVVDCFSRDDCEFITTYKITNENDFNTFCKALKVSNNILQGLDIGICDFDSKNIYYYIKTIKNEYFNYIVDRKFLPLRSYLQELVFTRNNIDNEISNIQDLLDLKVPEKCNQ